ncbi:MAG: PaaI family thioesterase [Firmicutes bacterium]|nr:PaaI family thioesterase [Bacillota bacterium]
MLPERVRSKGALEPAQMRELPPSSGCFACGLDNPTGLQIRFLTDGKAAYGEYVPKGSDQGYAGVLHGGILATLLDEVMVKALAIQGVAVVTGKIEMRFRHPAPIGKKLLIKGWVKTKRRNSFAAAGAITDQHGQVLAEAQGLFFPIQKSPSSSMGDQSDSSTHRSKTS